MKLLRISIYILIILAIAKITNGNNAQLPEETSFENTFTYKPDAQFVQQRLQEKTSNDTATFLNFYTNLPLDSYPSSLKSNSDSSDMFTRIYQANDLQNRISNLNLSFIVF